MNSGGEPSSWRMISWSTNHGGFGSVQDVGPTITNRIMLRFRPIAPKPANPDPSVTALANSYKPRKKRKYVRVRKSNRSVKKKDTSASSSSPDPKSSNHVVTLQLLPEKGHPPKEQEAAAVDRNMLSSSLPPRQCNLDLTVAASAAEDDNNSYYYHHGTDLVTWRRGQEVEESWVTVESAAEISSSSAFGYCMDLEEVKIRLDGDTCPGFVSDGCNRVVWVNGAYRRMVGTASVVRVVVVMKDDEVAASFRREVGGGAYTCWVRVRGATWRKEMVPCDVWRVENGGLAWRLDAEAALTLGPGSEIDLVGGITQGTLIAP
ncbi:unnamed protein product [Linum trigynum]|uniref:DUF7950 domain-containing protein n=1 Tax=Linum trigynum TaxID=586398 RepID=A0AAV2CR72_9ROSI